MSTPTGLPAPLHPLDARLLSELGTDYMVAYYCCGLLRAEDDPLRPRFISSQLDQIRDAESLDRTLVALGAQTLRELGRTAPPELERATAELRERTSAGRGALGPWSGAWERMLLEEVRGEPYSFEVPLPLQLSHRAKCIVEVLAVSSEGRRRLSPGGGDVQLAAELRVRPEAPPAGDGPVEIVEVGDLQDPFTAAGHGRVPVELGDASEQVRWRWVHGPLPHHGGAFGAAELAEACAATSPALFWDVVARLLERQGLPEAGDAEGALAGLGVDRKRVTRAVARGEFREAVQYDLNLLAACGVPPIRPAFVIGRKLFLGSDQAPRLREEVRRLLGAGGA